jgi:hypothetical protein
VLLEEDANEKADATVGKGTQLKADVRRGLAEQLAFVGSDSVSYPGWQWVGTDIVRLNFLPNGLIV